jgi:hypothetical protein
MKAVIITAGNFFIFHRRKGTVAAVPFYFCPHFAPKVTEGNKKSTENRAFFFKIQCRQRDFSRFGILHK